MGQKLNYPIEKIYALYNSHFVVAILNEEGTSYHEELAVFDLNNKEESPFLYSTDDKITIEAYKKFFKEIKDYLEDTKKEYKKNVKQKEKEEKEKQKKEKLSKFINEKNNNYVNTSWTKEIDGKETTITIKDVKKYIEKEEIPTSKIPVNDIFDMCIHKNKNDKKTIKRSEESNLNYPIIITKSTSKSKKKYTMILDGHHRLLKAKNHNKNKIKAKVIDLFEAPYKYKKMFE